MPIITLPDGNNLDFPKKITGLEVAEKISKSLAKQAMLISVDGELKDLDFLIEKNCSVKILFFRHWSLKWKSKFCIIKHVIINFFFH